MSNPSPEVKLRGRAVSIVSNFLKMARLVLTKRKKQGLKHSAKKKIKNRDHTSSGSGTTTPLWK